LLPLGVVCVTVIKESLCAPLRAAVSKTIMFTLMVKNHLKKGGKTLIFTHRKELLAQAGGAFEKFGLTPELIIAGSTPDLNKNLHVSMIETFDRRKFNYEKFLNSRTLIIIDEAHLNNFTKLFPLFNEKTIVIGATATPYRKGKKTPSLDEFYQDIVQEIDTPELIDSGYLSDVNSFGVEVDLSKAKKKGNDYDVTEIYEETQLWKGVVENWTRLAENTKTLLFSSNVKKSKQVAQQFIESGYYARHIDGKTPKKEREEILRWFDENPDAILCNCGVLTAGFDQPDIETIILYRATTSLPLFLQMCGRGSRVTENKKEFNILDFGNNIKRLGFWQKPREWSLEKIKTRDKKEGEEAIKSCPKCNAMLHISIKLCPYCGFKFPSVKIEKLAELERLEYVNVDKMSMEDLDLYAEFKGYKRGWVFHQLKTEERLIEYANYKNYKPGWVTHQLKNRDI